MKTTEQQHNERKREMMEKCFECYAENGLTGTGIKALADACGCTKANLYSYFKNLDELIIESTAYCMEKVEDDFMEKARAAVKSVNPSVKFGVYVGGWYASYYDVGVNWASPDYDTSSKFSWATKKYMDYGYADLMDQMLIGAYASPARVYGTTEWTMQGFCLLAKERTMGACPMVAGGPDVGNWDADDKVPQEEENRAITASVAACINACDGYFLFDMIHLKKAGYKKYKEF